MVKGKVCPTCGHLGYRQSEYCAIHAPEEPGKPRRAWDEIDAAMRQRYSREGAAPLAREFNVTLSTIQNRAQRLGLRVDPDAYRAIVHEAARKHMTIDNPMFRDETKAKVAAWMAAHPEVAERVAWALSEGQGRFQRKRVSSAERRLQRFLMELGVDFEPSYPFAKNRFADARAGRLIIQCDGDYWHGHPRFEPLTERQTKQQAKDRVSDDILRDQGFTVVRIWESDLGLESVSAIIEANREAIRRS